MRTNFKLNRLTAAVMMATAGLVPAHRALAGPGFVDATTADGVATRPQTYFANSPSGVRQTAVPEGNALPAGQNTGAALRKFVDPLPLLGSGNARFLNGDAAQANPKYIPVAAVSKWIKPDGTPSTDDYYELAVVEYSEKFHSDLVKATTLRGYVQIDHEASNGRAPLPGSLSVALTYPDGSPIMIEGTDANGKLSGVKVAALAVDKPHFLGPVISATKGTPTRIKFLNLLPTGRADISSPAVVDPGTGLTITPAVIAARNGDLFLPFDRSILGAGVGPDGITEYTQNRANIHLHGGDSPWISDGTPHQWVAPVGEADATNAKSLASLFATDPARDPTLLPSFLRGASTANVPDMFDPGTGASTYYYPNAQTARMLWYHDQTVGQTRLNAYAGMAAAYMLTDASEQAMVANSTLPPADRTIPLVLQDRTFVPDDIALQDGKWNTSAWGQPGDAWFPHVYESVQKTELVGNWNPVGRWYYGPQFWPIFPALYALPSGEYGDPSFTPEAYFDTPVVNGVAYPTLEVDPTTYRFRILNASVDRFMSFNLFEGKAEATLADGSLVTSLLGATEVDMVPASVPSVTKACPPGQGRPTPLSGTTAEFCTPDTWPIDSRVGGVPDPKGVGPTLYQIANEGGWLPSVAPLEPTPLVYNLDKGRITIFNPNTPALFLAPAERADVVVDFSQYAGKTLIVYNDSGAPEPGADPRNAYFTGVGDQSYGGGAEDTRPGYGPNIRTMMQIRVKPLANPNVVPPAYDPTALQAAVSAAYVATQDRPIVAQPAYAGFDANWASLSPTTSYASIYSATLKEPTFQFVPGSPSAAFNSIQVLSGGSGYVTSPSVTITSSNGLGSGATAKATMKLDQITVTNPGSGYITAPTVTIVAVAGGGNGAVAEVRLAPNVVTVTNGGSGYGANVPTVNFPAAPPGAVKPQAHAVVTNGVVTSVVVDVPGSGYASVPTVTFGAVAGATTARGTVSAGLDPVMRVVSPYPITPSAAGGGGYTDFGQVLFTFTGGGGSGAAATATGRVYDVSVTNNGSGYTAPPTVTLSSPPAGATATAQVDRANGGLPQGSLLTQSKAIQELFDATYGRYNTTLGVEIPFTTAFNQTTIPLGYLDEPTELIAHGETQLWKFTHNGLFTQPIHFRGYNVQLINRVGWDGFIEPPQPNEVGWKETVRVNPLEDAIVALSPKRAALPGFGLPNSIRPLDPTQPLGSPFGFTQIDGNTGMPKSVVNDIVNFGWEYSLQNGVQSRSESDSMRPVIFNANEAVPLAPTLNLAKLVGDTAELQFVDNSATEYKFSVRRADVDNATGLKSSAFAEVGTQLANGSQFTDTTILANSSYAYKVAAIGAAGEAESNEVILFTTTTPPVAPSTFSAVALSDRQVALSWVDNANNEVGYLLERSLDAGATWSALGLVKTINGTTQTYSLPANSQAYPDAGYTADTHVDYRLSAVNSFGPSASVTASVDTLAAPALATLTSSADSDTQVTLAWTLPAALKPNQTVSSYSITRNGGAGPASFTVAAPASGFINAGLQQNTLYTYAVAAVNSTGATPVTGTASTTQATTQFTLPSNIIGLTGVADAATQVTLNWGGGTPAQSYTVTRTGGVGGAVSFTVAAPASKYVDMTAAASTTYTYTVTAINGNKSSATASVNVTTPVQVNAPTMGAAASNATRIQINWTDLSTQETRFAIERSVNGGPFVQIATQNTGSRTGTGNVSTLNNSTTAPAGFTIAAGNVYSYRVIAQVVVGGVVTAKSLPSNVVTVAYTVPNAPSNGAVTRIQRNTGLFGIPAATDRIDLSWLAPTAVVGQPAVNSYTIEWSITNTFTVIAGSSVTGSTNTTATVNVARGNRAAPNPTSYFFRIKASNVVGAGTPSTVIGPANTL